MSQAKAQFKIKGKTPGEASLKVICDQDVIGWFHIWCNSMRKLDVYVVDVSSKLVQKTPCDLNAINEDLNDVFRQALVNVKAKSGGVLDMSKDKKFGLLEEGCFERDSNKKFIKKNGLYVINYDDAKKSLGFKKVLGYLKAKNKYKNKPNVITIFRYNVLASVYGGKGSVLGEAESIKSDAAYVYSMDTGSSRNTLVHELGHCLGLEHPLHNQPEFSKKNISSWGVAISRTSF